MYRILSYFLSGLLASASLAAGSPAAGETVAETTGKSAPRVEFSRDVQPLFAKHCLLCHGTDQAEAGLRLDSHEAATRKLDSGKQAIMPGKPDASELLRRVSSRDPELRMPPEGDPLSDAQIAQLRRWIAEGAVFETHWAYRPVTPPPLPPVKQEQWVRNPIDRFVLARLEQARVAPTPEASRATLIKRLSYDLIGLPPTPEEVDAFVADSSPQAYEQLVDRLLDSQHFGERWGRHWLDKARYADSDGYEKDRPRPNAWRYRDWVIEAVNRDLPFDQFTVEQLAGDLLPNTTPRQTLATAFHRQTLTNTEGGTDKEQFRVEATFDRTETTAAVWMGLTMTCARCHSHKYDQITQTEYYRLFSFFNSADEVNSSVATSDTALAAYEEQRAAHTRRLVELSGERAALQAKLQPEIDAWLAAMDARRQQAVPVMFESAQVFEATAASEAVLAVQKDGAVQVSGPVVDQDTYTLVVKGGKQPLTGLRLEALADQSLPKRGPGRAPNGNFVLSKLNLALVDSDAPETVTSVELTAAEADFTQQDFAPSGVLKDAEKSGWAIAPKMGKDHQLTVFTAAPVAAEGRQLQIELRQVYGGSHTLGRFRISLMSGSDPFREFPSEVAKALRAAPEQRTAAHRELLADHVLGRHEEGKRLLRTMADLKAKAPQPPMMTVRVMGPATRETRVLHRGDFLQPGDPVSSGGLAVLPPVRPPAEGAEASRPSRLQLARWLVAPEHPLTSRVIVNQVWAHLFGRGIVPTLNDFGVRGEAPTHPELLDWLAFRFPRDLGWSRKGLIREIVTSATYRQASEHRPELAQRDPTNRLFARQNRVRVEAEIVRDLHLAVSGLLSRKIGGPSVFPPLPPGVAELSYANNFKWQTSAGEDRYRRGMYTFFKRTSPHPTLVSFDCPDSNTTRLARDASNTPLQALVTLNNDVFTETAQAMARRVLADGGGNDADRLRFALRLCLTREPLAEEVDRFTQLLTIARKTYAEHPEEAAKLTQRHPAAEVPGPENAAWIATVRMLMNLDEFIVRD